MPRVTKRLAFVVGSSLIVIASLLITATCHGDSAKITDELVSEALRAGADGDWSKRQQMLAGILRDSPDQSLARWHSGFLQYGRTWVHVDQLADLLPFHDVLNAYEERREPMSDDAPGNLSLANWCRRHKLPEQQRAHLTRVVQLSPNHAQARRRLGHERVDGRWVATQELWQAASDSRRWQQVFKKWHPPLQAIFAALQDTRMQQRNTARDRLLAIRDVEAIPVIEAVFLGQTSGQAATALEAIANMPEYEASVALARQAVIAPYRSVRDQALQLVKRRPLEDYVPALLNGLTSPVKSRVFIDFVDGRLFYRHIFSQQNWEQNDLSVVDERYAYQPRGALPIATAGVQRINSGNTPEQLAAMALASAQSNATNRERQRHRQNVAAQRLNQRIATVLAETTGQEGLTSVQDWWSWWDSDNGIVYLQKPTNSRYVSNNYLLAGSSTPGGGGGGGRAECFAAGTPVWTASGPKAVEKVRVGDLVLSQDVESGEVIFKPVLLTSTRPEEELLRIDLGEDQLETTDGHPFWVSGHGWTLAKKLETPSSLYALDAQAKVHAVSKGSRQETYNLVVADFHTYFVGKSRVLVHDNTRQRATNAIVPGVTGNDRFVGP